MPRAASSGVDCRKPGSDRPRVILLRTKPSLAIFTRSKMTRGLSLPGFLQSTPEQAARGIERLLRSRRQAAFIPARWGLVMAVIRALPAFIFNRSNL